jgi:hypothetical protein
MRLDIKADRAVGRAVLRWRPQGSCCCQRAGHQRHIIHYKPDPRGVHPTARI